MNYTIIIYIIYIHIIYTVYINIIYMRSSMMFNLPSTEIQADSPMCLKRLKVLAHFGDVMSLQITSVWQQKTNIDSQPLWSVYQHHALLRQLLNSSPLTNKIFEQIFPKQETFVFSCCLSVYIFRRSPHVIRIDVTFLVPLPQYISKRMDTGHSKLG